MLTQAKAAAWAATLTGKVVLAVVALTILAGLGWKLYSIPYKAGQADTQKKWDASIERGRKEVERLKQQQVVVTTKVETVYVDRVKTIREKADAIEVVREVFVPADSGSLPGAFRLFYDAALAGTVPDASRIADAAPVPIAAVADTHARNAEKCLIAYETVDAWQEWARAQQKLNK